MSFVFLAKVLLLLVNVKEVEEQASPCNWVCDDTVKLNITKGTLEQTEFKFRKQVDRHCEGTEGDTVVNSWNFIRVGIKARDVDNLTEFNFWTFGKEVLSEHLWSFLCGNQFEELESVNNSVSCDLKPKPNVLGRVASNGLDELYWPLFYFRDSDRNSQRTPFVGYVEVDGKFHISADFTNNAQRTPKNRLKFDQWHLTRVRTLSIFLVVVFTLFSPTLLTLFCANIKTMQIERLSRATDVEEGEVNDPCSKATRTPTENPSVNLDLDHGILSAAGKGYAGKEYLLKQEVYPSWITDDLESGSSRTATEQDDAGINTHLSNQENTNSVGRSDMVGLPRPAKERNPPSTGAQFSQTHSFGISGHRSSSSASGSTMEQSLQTGVQHENFENRKLDSVEVMEVGGPASPVGLRSHIANKVFPKSKSPSWIYQIVLFVMLISFPLFFPCCMDVFVLGIPRLFSRIAANFPSPFLTKSALSFTLKLSNSPGFMYLCLLCYIIRIGCFCFKKSSSNWVPSFLDRKHFLCFWYNNYISQLFLKNFQSACDECKKAPEVEIPVNIKNNFNCMFSLKIILKNWKDFCEMYQCQCIKKCIKNAEASKCRSLKKWILFILCIVGLVLLFVALFVLDIIASLPAISLCYGRAWFISDLAQRHCEKRFRQFLFFLGEFLVIVFAIVWIVYFSVCCSLSLALALLMFCIAEVNYPVEILLSVCCYIMVSLIFWSCYCSYFTNVYEHLLSTLIKTCNQDHASELNRYKEGNVVYIPLKLFTSACDKLRPTECIVRKLCFNLLLRVFFLLLLFSLALESSIDIQVSVRIILGAIVTTLLCLWAALSSSEKTEQSDAAFEKKVKDYVDAFFKGKLD